VGASTFSGSGAGDSLSPWERVGVKGHHSDKLDAPLCVLGSWENAWALELQFQEISAIPR
jgi:hypothetical protein